MSLVQLKKTVAAAATPEALSSVDLWVDQLTIQILDQAGKAYVGDSNVSSSTYGYLFEAPGAGVTPEAITYRGKINLKTVYIAVETNGQGVACSYIPSLKNSPY